VLLIDNRKIVGCDAMQNVITAFCLEMKIRFLENVGKFTADCSVSRARTQSCLVSSVTT